MRASTSCSSCDVDHLSCSSGGVHRGDKGWDAAFYETHCDGNYQQKAQKVGALTCSIWLCARYSCLLQSQLCLLLMTRPVITDPSRMTAQVLFWEKNAMPLHFLILG